MNDVEDYEIVLLGLFSAQTDVEFEWYFITSGKVEESRSLVFQFLCLNEC